MARSGTLRTQLQMLCLGVVQPEGKQHRARMVSLSIPMNQKNQPVLARPCTMVVEISLSALHQTESLELQKVIKLMKGTNQATQTLPLEVNGGKVPYITEDIDLIRMLYVFRGRRPLQATIISAIRSHVVPSCGHQLKQPFNLGLSQVASAAPLPARNLALSMSRRGSTWRHMRNKGKRKNSSGPSCS
ncbi:uncharacterized protein LOC135640830 [Musa acuminata AAA Group]|uniref:uncharacterized protein LOC135640830 n=1 Tax=Musa acuminata AAA Group TaxID=214697 RepID=UPI0031E32391